MCITLYFGLFISYQWYLGGGCQQLACLHHDISICFDQFYFLIQTGKSEMRKIRIPPNRFKALKDNWLEIYNPIVKQLCLQVRFNIKAKRVEIKVRDQQQGFGDVHGCWGFYVSSQHLRASKAVRLKCKTSNKSSEKIAWVDWLYVLHTGSAENAISFCIEPALSIEVVQRNC